MAKPLRVVLLGKKVWAAKALKRLVDAGCEIPAVVAREPSAEIDRSGATLWETAHELGLKVMGDAEVYDALARGELGDVDVVLSYLHWAIVKLPLLDAARLGAINLHPAPLPELRGLGGYNVAILEGMAEYGVTAHFMDSTLDTGDVVAERRFPIDPERETAMSLERRSMEELYLLFEEVLELAMSGQSIPRTAQGEGRYVSRADFERMRRADLSAPAQVLARQARAFFFPPQAGAYVEVGGQEFTLVTDEILHELAEQQGR